MKGVFEDPQVIHNQLVRTMQHPTAGEIKVVGPAVTFGGCSNDVRFPPPLLGQHTRPVLKDVLGVDDQCIEELQNEKVIGCVDV